MKQIFLVCFFVLLVSCAPGKEKICDRIDDSIRTYMEKSASKTNKELVSHELKATGFDTFKVIPLL